MYRKCPLLDATKHMCLRLVCRRKFSEKKQRGASRQPKAADRAFLVETDIKVGRNFHLYHDLDFKNRDIFFVNMAA